VWVEGEELQMTRPLGSAANMKGEYFIINVPPGIYSVSVSYMGYKQEIRTKVKVYVDKTTGVDFYLIPAVIEGEGVTVTAYRSPKVEKDRTATKQVFDVSEVEMIAGVNDVSDLLDLQADVVDNHFRGGREGESLYLLGGAAINNPLNASRSFTPIVTGLQQVEVFTSGFSAEYGNAQSGVVNMVPKEGGEKWSTRLGYSMELPHYDNWGGSPFSQEYMPFWEKLNNAEEWLALVDSSVDQSAYLFHYSGYDDFLSDESTSSDSLYAARMARADYVQALRDIGLQFDNNPVTRFDFSIGGPISDKLRVFIAARQSKSTPFVPMPHPNLTRQWMSNLTAYLSSSDKLTLSLTYNDRFSNSISDWFDRVFQSSKKTQSTVQYGVLWNHVINNSTFLNVSLNALSTYEEEHPEFLDPDRYTNTAGNGENTGTVQLGYILEYKVKPTDFSMNKPVGKRGYEDTDSYSLNASMTSQISTNNMIKTGLQLQSYQIDVFSESNLKDVNQREWQDFTAHPYEGAIYIQDKMEFEGMIANFGLRYDFYNFNTDYYIDQFRPLYNPLFTEGVGTVYD
ncbi:hypothetical protein BVY01_00615, partial [bacterium I07]